MASTAAQANEMPQYTNGTAFFITPDGYLLTANHVIKNCGGKPYISGRFIIDGNRLVAPQARLGEQASAVETTIEVKPIATSEANDLALLKILPPLTVENVATFRDESLPLEVGEMAIAVGYPLASVEKMRLLEFQTVKGSVIAINAPGAPASTFMASSGGKTLGTHGYSGGPVLDESGNVIGINLAVSCLGRGCIESIKQFKAAYGDDANHSPLAPELYQQKLEEFLDSSIIADLASINAFIAAHTINVSKNAFKTAATTEKIVQSSHAITNLGCTAKTEVEILKSMKLSTQQ